MILGDCACEKVKRLFAIHLGNPDLENWRQYAQDLDLHERVRRRDVIEKHLIKWRQSVIQKVTQNGAFFGKSDSTYVEMTHWNICSYKEFRRGESP